MPPIKVYMMVTNDKYELPVKLDIMGAQGVADYMGLTIGHVRKCLARNYWPDKNKVKPVFDEYGSQLVIKERGKKWEYGTEEYNEYQRKRYREKKERKKNGI